MSDTVRLRFAPSPTGYLHVGGLRTAIFNYLYARRHGGTFILRIEDTDVERSTQAAVDQILDSLRWIGLTWDEGPYYQSQRTDLYRQHLDRLLTEGKAYRCYCTPEELDAKRQKAEAAKRQYKYDGACRNRDPHEDPAGRPFTVRFRSPQSYPDHFDDLILGRLPIDEARLDDWILARTDGTPVYNFCVVVDDSDMRISHVMRGNDHVNNTPRQILLYLAFGYAPPRFAHIPLIHGPDGSKLSKRKEAEYQRLGMSVSVQEYQRMGYLPHALLNYMTRVGWSHGDQEIFTREELERVFDIDHVGKSAGVMNPEKLRWLNAHYIKSSDDASLARLVVPLFGEHNITVAADERLERVVAAEKERAKTLVELVEASIFFYCAPTEYDAKSVKKWWGEDAKGLLTRARNVIETINLENEGDTENALRSLAAEMTSGNLGKVAQPIRLALTGTTVSPPLFTVMAILGREETLARIDRAIQVLDKT